jgi:hypothetical protein
MLEGWRSSTPEQPRYSAYRASKGQEIHGSKLLDLASHDATDSSFQNHCAGRRKLCCLAPRAADGGTHA